MQVKVLIITFEPTISMSFNIVLLLGITRAVGFLGTYFPAKCKRTDATCLLSCHDTQLDAKVLTWKNGSKFL